MEHVFHQHTRIGKPTSRPASQTITPRANPPASHSRPQNTSQGQTVTKHTIRPSADVSAEMRTTSRSASRPASKTDSRPANTPSRSEAYSKTRKDMPVTQTVTKPLNTTPADVSVQMRWSDRGDDREAGRNDDGWQAHPASTPYQLRLHNRKC